MPGLPRKLKINVAADLKQKNILSYFNKKSSSTTTTTPTAERNNDEMTDIEKQQVGENVVPSTPPNKKAKLDIDKNSPASSSECLTPEQRAMINRKAMTARILKTSQSLKIIDPLMGPSWYSALEGEFKKDYFLQLSEFVTAQRNRATIYPQPGNVWEWTKHGPIDQVKVVILGQDPYHGPNQAHGLCFSVQKGVPPPPSLVNMYKELGTDINGFVHPQHGYLIGWAEQGVLLLNAVLTVESGKANSHKDKGWEKVTDAVISWISVNLSSVVFLLWGAYAQKKAAFVDKKRHHILQTVHPSPLSAHRGFLGCKHFSKCNELLIQSGKTPIDWTKL
ncbi:uracil-DNA glycosylase [Folsomia candida]|uniref:Uracil-DNA glycosylase n=1 Tax=Folsomia candida TaxID=158441 RepID=A0A226E3B7_FOLCA|nr:uracil-DNA glycosylase [Folsomia candida]OXA51770.1 Uracil-DNA glycosylase [Folsomia candida]